MIRTTFLALLLAMASIPARANDTTAQLKTGGLEFTRSDAISMQEEKLYISPKEVRVDYIFRNTTDKPVETYVAFPMPDIVGSPEYNVDYGDANSDNFLGFTVSQQDEGIKPMLQQRAYSADIDMTDIITAANIPLNPIADATKAALAKLPKETVDDWQTRGLLMTQTYDAGEGEKTEFVPLWTLKSAYYWKTTFPAGQDVHVSHKYRPSVGGTVALTYLEDNQPKGERYAEYKAKYCIDDAFVKLAQKSSASMEAGKSYYYENWISYILTTGANWQGPIAKFTLVIDKGEPDNRVSFCGTGVKKTGPTTFEMTATDFYPDKDLEILLAIPSQAP